MTDEVICRVEGAIGRVTLNRPNALHALNTAMVQAMTEALLGWRLDPAVQAILIDHSGERGFCAGGDIRFLADSAAEGGEAACDFFFREYRLNHLLMVFPKPVIAIMDGVTMGGGVGLALPARYRIATERTRLAMPETAIGLFPDVGGGWHLSRLPGRTGVWLALTGARLEAADCLFLGLATHSIAASSLETMKGELLARPGEVEMILNRFAQHLTEAAPVQAIRSDIDRLYGGHTLEAIRAAMAADSGAFARAELALLDARSPLSLKTALRQVEEGASIPDFAAEMRQEMRIGARMVMSHDFREGVRAVIRDKDNRPLWSPATLEGVSRAMLDAVFAPLPLQREWTPLPDLA